MFALQYDALRTTTFDLQYLSSSELDSVISFSSRQVSWFSEHAEAYALDQRAKTLASRLFCCRECLREADLSRFLELAQDRALDIGFTAEDSIHAYSGWCSELGLDCGRDPQYAVLGIPASLGYRSEAKLVKRITQRVDRWRKDVQGARNSVVLRVLADGLNTAGAPAQTPDIARELFNIELLWPEKLAFCGPALLYHTLRQEFDREDRFGLDVPRRVLMVLVFGAYWRANPIYAHLDVSREAQTGMLYRLLDELKSEPAR